MYVDWFFLGAIVGFSIMVILMAGSVYGTRHLRHPEEPCPRLGHLYLRVAEKRVTRFMYEFLAIEAPFLCVLLAGYLMAPSDLMDFLFGPPVPEISSFLAFITIGFITAVSCAIRPEWLEDVEDD